MAGSVGAGRMVWCLCPLDLEGDTMTQAYTPDWRDGEYTGPQNALGNLATPLTPEQEAELDEAARYYDTHDTSAELEKAERVDATPCICGNATCDGRGNTSDKVYEVQQIYRVVDAETNQPLATGGYHGRQHVYLKQGTAQGVVTQKNNYYARIGSDRRYKVQVADAEWRDL